MAELAEWQVVSSIFIGYLTLVISGGTWLAERYQRKTKLTIQRRNT